MASVLDWTKYGKIILTPFIDIDNLNLPKMKPLWSLMTKGEKLHKDSEKMTKRENFNIGGEI